MTRLNWDQVGERFYETGVSRGVLYRQNRFGVYDKGYAWNGLTAVTESPSGAESNKQYADNIPYLNLVSAEDFGGTIEAFQSPVEFNECDGTATPIPGIGVGQQTRRSFGFSYQTLIGNDIDGQDHAYKIHVVYGALASPSEKNYATVNESPEAAALSWEFSTTPAPFVPEVLVEGRPLKPTATLTFDSRLFTADKMKQLEDVLYGTESLAPRLPTPYELIQLMTADLVVAVPKTPEFTSDAGEGVISIPTITGVVYHMNGEVVTSDVTITEAVRITATPGVGYKFEGLVPTDWVFVP